jgi:NADP-dependent 3-hydroxy acid dehydrogenase YdfG
MQRLKQKTALVTGASAGIGRATALALGAEGAHVVLAARRRNRLEAVAAELESAEVVELDVCDAERCSELLSERTFDIVVANAGIGLGLEPIHEGDPENWRRMLDTNVNGLLHIVRSTLPQMIARGAGDQVVLGSVAGFQVYPGGNVYCASKYAARAIYEALRIDAGGKGVRFSSINPGMVESDFSIVRFGGDTERAKSVYAGMTPLRPEDVADAVLYAVTRPKHMNVGEMVLWPTDQTSTSVVHRR